MKFFLRAMVPAVIAPCMMAINVPHDTVHEAEIFIPIPISTTTDVPTPTVTSTTTNVIKPGQPTQVADVKDFPVPPTSTTTTMINTAPPTPATVAAPTPATVARHIRIPRHIQIPPITPTPATAAPATAVAAATVAVAVAKEENSKPPSPTNADACIINNFDQQVSVIVYYDDCEYDTIYSLDPGDTKCVPSGLCLITGIDAKYSFDRLHCAPYESIGTDYRSFEVIKDKERDCAVVHKET